MEFRIQCMSLFTSGFQTRKIMRSLPSYLSRLWRKGKLKMYFMTRAYQCISIGVLLLLPFLVMYGEVKADGSGEIDERIEMPLINAGVKLDDSSLMEALKNKDMLISSRAAIVLGTRKKTESIIKALSKVAQSDNETVAVTSMHSLEKLGDMGWPSIGKERLPKIQDRALQLELAVLLAKAGQADGWQVIIESINDPNYSAIALMNVEVFDCMKKKDGTEIDVVEELNKISKSAPKDLQFSINRKIDKIINQRAQK